MMKLFKDKISKEKVNEEDSVDTFKNRCRSEFEFLILEFGFEENKVPADYTKNPYLIEFVRSDLRVSIEGVSYGAAADMYLQNSKGRRILADYLNPNFNPFIERRTKLIGQIKDIKRKAGFLRQYGLKLLQGDISVLEKAIERADSAIKEYESRQ